VGRKYGGGARTGKKGSKKINRTRLTDPSTVPHLEEALPPSPNKRAGGKTFSIGRKKKN